MRFFIIALLLSTIYCFGLDYNLRAYTITEGVSCFFGKNQKVNTNTCYIETKRGYIVIDSGPTYSYAQQAYAFMQKKRKLPIKYVINTSANATQILGNKFYKERGATLIGPKSYKTLLKNSELVPLDIYQNSNSTISTGDTTIEIKKFDNGESKRLVIFIPEKEIIFVGDYIYNREEYITENQNALSRFKKSICKIENLPWQYIISSRGTKMGRETIKDTQSYLNAIVIPIKREIIERRRNRRRKRNYKKRAIIKFA